VRIKNELFKVGKFFGEKKLLKGYHAAGKNIMSGK
jgi:hypothetical protein